MNVKSILEKLVSFDVLGGESNLDLAKWIVQYLSDHGVEAHMLYNEERNKALVHCRIGPAADGGVVLSGHMDVVPVEGQDWNTDPFTLTEKGGLLYGRGSCDMKGFLACCLSMVTEFKAANLKKPVYFAFSYDEEIGCMAGDLMAQTIRDFYPENCTDAIIGEPSLMEPIIGQKGICFYRTYVNGSEGHSSRIMEEVSAVHESARLILWLEDKMKRLKAERTDARFNPPHSSIHVGKVKGGIATNIVADQCYFDWDVRTIPGDDFDDIMNDFYGHCEERMDALRSLFPAFKIYTEEVHPPVPPLDTASDSKILKLLRSIGINGPEQTVSFAAEAGQFERNGFDAIICGPGSIAQAHRANEFIAVDQLDKGRIMLRNLIHILSE